MCVSNYFKIIFFKQERSLLCVLCGGDWPKVNRAPFFSFFLINRHYCSSEITANTTIPAFVNSAAVLLVEPSFSSSVPQVEPDASSRGVRGWCPISVLQFKRFARWNHTVKRRNSKTEYRSGLLKTGKKKTTYMHITYVYTQRALLCFNACYAE